MQVQTNYASISFGINGFSSSNVTRKIIDKALRCGDTAYVRGKLKEASTIELLGESGVKEYQKILEEREPFGKYTSSNPFFDSLERFINKRK